MRAVRFDIQDIAEANLHGYGHKTRTGLESRYMNEILVKAYKHVRRQYPVGSVVDWLSRSERWKSLIIDGEELALPKAVKGLTLRNLSITFYLSDEDVELHNEIASIIPEPANK